MARLSRANVFCVDMYDRLYKYANEFGKTGASECFFCVCGFFCDKDGKSAFITDVIHRSSVDLTYDIEGSEGSRTRRFLKFKKANEPACLVVLLTN